MALTKEQKESPLALRFDETGLGGFTQLEALELLLEYTSIRSEKKRRETAVRLLEEFGSIERIFRAKHSELVKKGGLTDHSAALFCVIPEVIRVSSMESAKKQICPDVSALSGIFCPCYAGAGEEKLLMAGFDCKLELLGIDCISSGTNCCTSAGMREILDRVVSRDLSIIAISHNHPFGTCAPSDEDVSVTRELCRACRLMGVYMMDHLIAGTDGCCSLRVRGDISFLD